MDGAMFRAALVLDLIALSGAAACVSKKSETEAPQRTAARPFIVHDDVVELDYGQFFLAGGLAGLAPDRYVGLLEKALDGPGIASATLVLVAQSPHQNNFAMPLRIEVWRQQPPDDLAAWQEVLEAALDVDDAGQLWFESPTMRQHRWPPDRTGRDALPSRHPNQTVLARKEGRATAAGRSTRPAIVQSIFFTPDQSRLWPESMMRTLAERRRQGRGR
jgi:hypothetical protein